MAKPKGQRVTAWRCAGWPGPPHGFQFLDPPQKAALSAPGRYNASGLHVVSKGRGFVAFQFVIGPTPLIIAFFAVIALVISRVVYLWSALA